MALAIKEEYKAAIETQKAEVRSMVLDGLKQVNEGKTKDVNEVFDRLEKKYISVAIQDQNK